MDCRRRSFLSAFRRWRGASWHSPVLSTTSADRPPSRPSASTSGSGTGTRAAARGTGRRTRAARRQDAAASPAGRPGRCLPARPPSCRPLRQRGPAKQRRDGREDGVHPLGGDNLPAVPPPCHLVQLAVGVLAADVVPDAVHGAAEQAAERLDTGEQAVAPRHHRPDAVTHEPRPLGADPDEVSQPQGRDALARRGDAARRSAGPP